MTNLPTTTSTRPTDRRRTDRRRMILAVLAGGVVLGVGTAMTLAAWSDSEFATGSFTSGQFDLEGSTDGTGFSDSEAAPGKQLTFELNADLLTPGAVVYAPFAVKLSADSDYSTSVTIGEAVSGAIGEKLTYSLYDVGTTFGATCSAGAPPQGAALVAARSATATGTVAAFDLTTRDATNLCFVVTAAGDLAQATTGTVTWEFAGTPGAPLS